MAEEDIHKTSANTTSSGLAPEPPPAKVALDSSSFSARVIARVVLLTLLLVFAANRVEMFIDSLTHLFFLLVLSIFFAYLIDPLVKLVRRPFKLAKLERFMPRAAAILIAYVVVFAVLGLGVASLAPRVLDQSKEFITNVPTYTTTIRERVFELNKRFDRLRLPEQVETKINDLVADGVTAVTTFITSVVLGGFLLNFVAYTPWLVLVPVLSFFFLKDVNLFRLAVLRAFPAGQLRMRAESVMQDVNTTLAAYTRAQLISCVLISLLCTVGFYIIGLKYALLLGILAGIFEFVPMIGPALIGIIVIATASFSDRPWNGLYVFIFLIVLRIIHDYVTYPRIVRGGIHLHPVLIILSVLAGEQVAGIPGVFLAIPIVAILTVIYRHVLEHKGRRGLFDALSENEPAAAEDA